MAIRPQDIYPGQVTTGDPGYPHGKAKNEAVPDDGTGTPLEERLVNDIFGLEQALLDAAGITPSGTPDQVGASQYLDAIKHITDSSLYNWRSFVSSAVEMSLPSERLRLAVCQDTLGGRLPAYLICKSSVAGRLYRTRDFFVSQEYCTQLVDGSPVAITAIWGDTDRSGNVAVNDLLVIDETSKLYQSLDAGITWGAGIVLGAVFTEIARSHPLGLVIVAGTGTIKTLTSALGSLTSRTVPGAWAALTAGGIAVARGGESTAAGAVIWPFQASTAVLHSPDGATWTNQPVPSGQVISACWSESYQKWFALTTLGLVFSSSNPSTTAWTLVATLFNTGGPNFYAIRSVGRSLVIACGLGSGPYDTETGTIIVTKQPTVPSSYRALSTGQGALGDISAPDTIETTLVHYDGQIVAGHVHTYSGPTSYAPNLSVSMRSP